MKTHSRDWVPLLLEYTAAKSSGEAAADAATSQKAVGGQLARGSVNKASGPLPGGSTEGAESDSDDEADGTGLADGAEAAESGMAVARASHSKASASVLETAPLQAAADGEGEHVALASHVGGQAWRGHLKVRNFASPSVDEYRRTTPGNAPRYGSFVLVAGGALCGRRAGGPSPVHDPTRRRQMRAKSAHT